MFRSIDINICNCGGENGAHKPVKPVYKTTGLVYSIFFAINSLKAFWESIEKSLCIFLTDVCSLQ